MELANGTYKARPIAGVSATIEQAKSGAVMLYVKFQIENGPALRGSFCLVNKQDEIMTNTMKNLKAWSGWDGVDPYWFMENDLSEIEVELVIENAPGFKDPTKLFAEIKWVNPPGSGGLKLPEPTDKKLFMAKFGSKFRAMAGGQPPVTRTPAPAAKPVTSAPPARTPPPVAKPAGATQAMAWDLINKNGAGMKPEELEAAWFKLVDATGMDQAEMTPEGWQQVMDAIQAASKDGTLMPF